jgi:hypothetical protein
MRVVPRYLRYIAAASVAVTVYFVIALSVGAAYIGTGNDPKPLNGAVGLLVSLLAQVGPVVSALFLNDWLKSRYPEAPKQREFAGK